MKVLNPTAGYMSDGGRGSLSPSVQHRLIICGCTVYDIWLVRFWNANAWKIGCYVAHGVVALLK